MDDVIELNKCLSRIKYGWHDKDNNTYEKLDKSEFQKKYKMPSLNQIKKNGIYMKNQTILDSNS